MKLHSLVIVLLLLAFTPVKAQKMQTVSFADTLSLEGIEEIYLYNMSSIDLDIVGSQTLESQFIFDGKIVANQTALSRNYDNGILTIEQEGTILKVYFQEKDNEQKEDQTWIKSLLNKKKNYESVIEESRLSIQLYSSVNVNIRSRYSDIKVSKFSSNVNIRGRSGELSVKEVEGSVSLTMPYSKIKVQTIVGSVDLSSRSSSIEISDLMGSFSCEGRNTNGVVRLVKENVSINARSSDLTISEVGGTLDFKGGYSKLDIEKVSANVSVENRSGTINIKDVPSVEIDGQYSDMLLENIFGSVESNIETRSSEIEIDNMVSNLRFEGKYNKLLIKDSSGNFNIENPNGTTSINHLFGTFRYDGDYGNLEVAKSNAEKVKISGRNLSIEFNQISDVQDMDMSLRYGEVALTLPSELNAMVDITTDGGTFNLGYTFDTIIQRIEASNEIRFKASSGNKKGRIIISADESKISIK